MVNILRSSINSPCAACVYSHKGCLPCCQYAKKFRNVIGSQDYRTIFTVFGVKNVASFLQKVPECQYLETLNSFLFKAKARIENPVGGCATRMASLEQKVEKLQSRMTALEARLEGGSSSAKPSSSSAPSRGYLNLLMSAEEIAHEIPSTTVNLSEYGASSSVPFGGYLNLLMSEEEIAPEIPHTTVNLSEHGTLSIEANLPAYPTLSDYQAVLDVFSSQSSQVDSVAEAAELTSPDWAALVDIRHNFSDFSSSDLDAVLNFDADDLQILQPFFE